MDASLALTALFVGLAGGPHCLAMCGPVCVALSPSGSSGAWPAARYGDGVVSVPRVGPLVGTRLTGGAPSARSTSDVRPLLLFQLGRLLAYAALGGTAAASMQALGWLSAQTAALRPVWTAVHVAAALLGATLLWRARQPQWLEEGARRLWAMARDAGRAGQAGGAAPFVLGLVWAFLPCGLLQSALLLAALSPSVGYAALLMGLFAVGSGLSLLLGPWLWGRWARAKTDRWAVRLAGAALLTTSLWALWVALVQGSAPWCLVSPPTGA